GARSLRRSSSVPGQRPAARATPVPPPEPIPKRSTVSCALDLDLTDTTLNHARDGATRRSGHRLDSSERLSDGELKALGLVSPAERRGILLLERHGVAE